MATAMTCTTPGDGWALYHHFIGNKMLVIRMLKKRIGEGDGSEDEIAKREGEILNIIASLIGYMYIIMHRMRKYGYMNDADKMQQVIKLAMDLNLINPETHDEFNAKFDKLRPKAK